MLRRTALFAFSCVLASTLIAADTPAPFYKLVPEHEQDKATASENGELITISSPTGIGRMEIQRLQAKWPAKLVFRIGVRGLEGFDIQSSTQQIHGSGKTDEPDVRELKPSGEWKEVAAEGKHRIKTEQGKGYYDVTVPASLLEENPTKLKIQWIDFYRG